MKLYKSFYIGLIAVLIQFSVQAQSTQTVAGTWTVDVDKSLLLMDNSRRLHYDSLRPELKERARTSMSGRKLEFSSAQQVTITWIKQGAQQTLAGTYSLDDANHTLTITQGGTAQQFEYRFEPSGALVLVNRQAFGFFSSLYLTKQ